MLRGYIHICYGYFFPLGGNANFNLKADTKALSSVADTPPSPFTDGSHVDEKRSRPVPRSHHSGVVTKVKLSVESVTQPSSQQRSMLDTSPDPQGLGTYSSGRNTSSKSRKRPKEIENHVVVG